MMATRDGFTGPVNLGNPNEKTILELAELIIELTGTNSKIINKELPENDPVRRKPDITVAKNELKWTPKVELEDGLKEAIKYFRSVL